VGIDGNRQNIRTTGEEPDLLLPGQRIIAGKMTVALTGARLFLFGWFSKIFLGCPYIKQQKTTKNNMGFCYNVVGEADLEIVLT